MVNVCASIVLNDFLSFSEFSLSFFFNLVFSTLMFAWISLQTVFSDASSMTDQKHDLFKIKIRINVYQAVHLKTFYSVCLNTCVFQLHGYRTV